VCGHIVLFGTGWIASRILRGDRPADLDRLTIYGLKKFRTAPAAVSAEAGRA
jgi:hypothetical protein